MHTPRWTRRRLFHTTAALGFAAAPAASATPKGPTVYTRIGGKPFINLTATYTINGGTLTWPEVKRAMDEASYFPVNLDELMDSVGARLAELLGAEYGIVTAGCAAALTHATAACVAGADPEKMQQLPDLTGLRNEVLVAKQSRNQYDQAVRGVGVKMVEFDSRESFQNALGPRTAMIFVLGTAEARGAVRLEALAEAGRRAGVPVLVDAAAELPVVPNPYLSRGADLAAYSGGKILRGPQCAGVLLGRQDLVRAAWLNSSPHHALGRPMKVGKEEIMGMLAAIEVWRNRYDLQADYKQWESWYAHISEVVTQVESVSTKILPPAGPSPFPVMEISWEPTRVGLTAGQLGRTLLDGEPRIMSHAEGNGHSFILRPVAMKPGEHKIVARRLLEIFRAAPKESPKPSLAPPSANIAGRWKVRMQFVSGSTEHELQIEVSGNQLTGTHAGRLSKGEIRGTIDGESVSFHSRLPYEGSRLPYDFRGKATGGGMSGEVLLGEYGRARWTAVRA
jgi:seryl-tRNA(Sec) selenium transferase